MVVSADEDNRELSSVDGDDDVDGRSNYTQHFLLPYVFLLHMWLSPTYVVIVTVQFQVGTASCVDAGR